MPEISVIGDCTPDHLPQNILTSTQPLVLKGLIGDWPAVKAAAAMDYLRPFCQQTPVTAMIGSPQINGRFFYNHDMSGFNFERQRLPIETVFNQLEQHQQNPKPPALYVGSTSVDQCLPGFRAENDLNLGQIKPLVSAWMGNQTRIAAHYDVPDNIACVVAGKRRFTLFPPDQLQNLYVGPTDFNPAGQAISLVDFQQPDFDQFPRFEQALNHAYIAELEPGDALFIPSMWWHHVEALDSFNLLINYWWRQTPAYMGAPMDALRHALLSIGGLPEEQRQVWANMFHHYVFHPDENTLGHIPEARRGELAVTDELAARKLRSLLINKLNR